MSKLTVTLPDDLHAQIRQELEEQGITTGQFIEMVVTKYFTKDKKGATDMATRTIAFQVSEELYQRIKDYLKHYEETYGRMSAQPICNCSRQRKAIHRKQNWKIVSSTLHPLWAWKCRHCALRCALYPMIPKPTRW